MPGVAPPRAPRGSSALRGFGFERRWLVRVFEALIPSGADARMPFGAADAPMGAFVDDLLARAPLEFVLGLRATLWLIMLAPLFLLGRPKTFLSLDAGARDDVLARLGESSIYLVREAPLLFKTIGCLGFCGLPAVHRKLGIHPTDDEPPAWARGDEP